MRGKNMKNKFKKENYIKQSQSSTGMWFFEVRIPKLNVDKTFSEKKYLTPRNAYDEAIKYRNKALLGDICKESRITTKEVLIESYNLYPIREETKRKHLIYFNNYVQDVPISEVTKADIIQSLNKASAELSEDGINRVMSVWKRIFKSALVNEYVNKDLTQGIKAPKSQLISKPQKRVIISRSELNEVLGKIDKTFTKSEAMVVKMALEVMWYTGLRPSECFALLKSDIQDGYINVDKQLGTEMAKSDDYIDKNVVVRTCKTQTSVRKIPISNNLQKLLDNYQVKGNILFPNSSGGYYNISFLSSRLHKLDKNFYMYQLRHTVATHLIVDCGADERTVREILGHEHIDMSVYYARSNDDRKKSVLDTI